MPTHHDDRHIEQACTCPFFEQGDTVGVGHPDVEQNQIGPGFQAGRSGLRRVFSQFNLMTFVVQNLEQKVPNAKLVIDHQNCCHVAFLVQVELGIGQSK